MVACFEDGVGNAGTVASGSCMEGRAADTVPSACEWAEAGTCRVDSMVAGRPYF